MDFHFSKSGTNVRIFFDVQTTNIDQQSIVLKIDANPASSVIKGMPMAPNPGPNADKY